MLFFDTSGGYAFDEIFLHAAINDHQRQHIQNSGGAVDILAAGCREQAADLTLVKLQGYEFKLLQQIQLDFIRITFFLLS